MEKSLLVYGPFLSHTYINVWACMYIDISKIIFNIFKITYRLWCCDLIKVKESLTGPVWPKGFQEV